MVMQGSQVRTTLYESVLKMFSSAHIKSRSEPRSRTQPGQRRSRIRQGRANFDEFVMTARSLREGLHRRKKGMRRSDMGHNAEVGRGHREATQHGEVSMQ
mmetsp:Transcript_81754/g.175170  ORF Transcript_81754/g.175170 Transcript_81754/m.175170 type:complete len:100 (-) Transcript_81754:87-386(-)